MKHILFSLIALCFLCAQSLAQTPNKFNYQAVAKDAGGPITTIIDVRFTIHDGSATGAEVYKEEHLGITPNNEGLFALQIGGGTALGGTNWNNINWSSGAKFLKVEIQKGTGGYTQMGTPQELVSVPYSMNSKGLELPFFKQNDQQNPSFQINNAQGDALKGVSSGDQKAGVRGEFYGSNGSGLSGWGDGANTVGLSAGNASGNWASLATPDHAARFNGILEADNSELRINNNGSFVQTGCDPNPFLELKGKGGTFPYIDFSGDLNDDYGARILYNKGAGALDFSGPFQYSLFSGSDQLYLNWFPQAGGPRRGWMGFGSPGTHNFSLTNEWNDGSINFSANGGFSFLDGTISVPSDNAEAPNLSVRNNANIAIRGESSAGDAVLGVTTGDATWSALAGHCNSPNGNAVWGGNLASGKGGLLGGKDYAGYFWGGGIRIDGNVQQELSNYTYFKNAGVPLSYPVVVPLATQYIGGGGGVVGYSVYASERMACSELNVFSDRRIKNIVGISDSRSDLEILNKIEITDYFFKDPVSKGNKPQKKVIGQQIAEVYPQAVSTNNKEIVPDIMQMSVADNGWVRLTGHDLKPGDRVRLLFKEGKEELEVTEATSEGFRVASDKSGEVFVYGREVSDFHIVDYEAIAMLNVSATQELTKKVADLEKQLAERDVQLTAALTMFETLRQDVAALKAERSTDTANENRATGEK